MACAFQVLVGGHGGCGWLILSMHAAAVVVMDGFTLVLVHWTPRLPIWVVAFYLDFIWQMVSVSIGGVSVAMAGWHSLEVVLAWPECAKTGLIGRSPTISVGVFVL